MRKTIFLALVTTLSVVYTNAQNIALNHLASFKETTATEGWAETVAYSASNNYAYVTNSASNTLSIVNVSTPNTPALVTNIDLSTYGAGPNSVAVYGNMVAVAMENAVKQNNGNVIFFDLNGAYVNTVVAGALPDMLTFTPDGTKVLVANEGEPSDDYTVDPEGSITVIDLSAGVANATTTTIGFTAYNTKKASLLNKGVRIFGKNGTATVAQDLEPEFITVLPDNSKAFVNCQENNAFAVIDLTNNSVLDIIPLGYKNHSLGTPSIEQYTINELVANWPSLGTPVYDGGQPAVDLGGFSGLYFDEANSTATDFVFYAVPDRGPNGDSVKKDKFTPATVQNVRPFKLPDYQGRIVKFTLNKTNGTVTLDNQILLTRQDGTTPITGKGNIPGFDEIPVTYADASTAYPNADYTDADNETYHALTYDAFGGDFEGVLIDKDGKFWLCDEYRPAIYKFEPNGTLIERYVPNGTSTLGTTPQPTGTYGAETLPEVYSKRRANRGFEAIAYDKTTHKIYAFIQTPMYNPSSVTKNNSDVIRILEIDASNGNPTGEFVYLLERNRDAGHAVKRVDKIGDAVYKGDGKFLVIERDSSNPDVEEAKKYIFEIDITYATNVLGQTYTKELEEMTADEIAAENILTAHKTKVVNLPSLGYNSSDKPEGIALLPNNEIAVLNDNDFGLAGAGVTDKSVLGIISFANDYKFDASNRDLDGENGKINIVSHPTLGMFMPDAITTYQANGKNYIVTANEGDARDYDGYSEEKRVKKLTLNPAYYPNFEDLQKDQNLGRLKSTTATGDYNGDGTIEQIYSYGARSFSIFDEYGNIVFDSADEFGQKTAIEEPNVFNEDDGDFDNRSDDKGVEPEAIAIGTIGSKTYAFIGLERQSSIIVYDITDPKNVNFITYYKGNRTSGDVAPEIIKFVPASDNQSSKNLLLVGYEVSGTLGVIEIGDSTLSTLSNEVAKSTFKLYPNPVVNEQLQFNKILSANIYSVKGQLVKTFENKTQVTISELAPGLYIIKTKNNGVKRFVKL